MCYRGPHVCTVYVTKTNKMHLLTHSMVQSPSWEANWFAASQEIPCISRNPKVHYRTHKRPPPVSILGQPNPVHIPTSTSWRSILILSTHLRLGLPSGLLPSGFPSKTLYTPSPHPYVPHAQPICRHHKLRFFVKNKIFKNDLNIFVEMQIVFSVEMRGGRHGV